VHETSLLAAGIVFAIAGCAHADPCGGAAECPSARVCGLAGACVARPTSDAVRFVDIRELSAVAGDDEAESVLLVGDGRRVELDFGPMPRGRVVSAVLKLSPYPGPSRQAEAVAEVRRGRERAAVRYAIGRGGPLLVDVGALVEDADAGEALTLVISMRGSSGVTFEASSPRSADPSLRPTLTLVLR
jgi:hypothetical protein